MRVMIAEFAEGRPVEVLRTGSFVDMYGLDVTIDVELMDEMVVNFAAGAAGQEVPVDIDHYKSEAAGWVTALYREGDRLFAQIDWNELGAQLVGGRVYRYVSAFLDLTSKVLKSVSLVNFPAVKGLAPVELSEGVFGFGGAGFRPDEVLCIQQEKERNMSEELREQIRAELEAELAEQRKTEAQLRAQIREEMRPQIEAELARRQRIVAFAEQLTTGAVALSTPAEQVVAFLEAQPAELLDQAMSLLQAPVVEFREQGSSAGREETQLKALPEEFVRALRAGDLELADLDNEILELGDLGQYDLSEFER